jgi:hypothetical protein
MGALVRVAPQHVSRLARSPMTLALFGITNDGLNLAVNLLILFLVVVWIALIVWTYLDARRRLDDGVLVAAATVASFFPFVGSLVYSILRPPELLEDKRERDLEIRSAELRVRQLEEASCPNCSFPIERTYLRCPSCRARVKDPCEACGKPIDPRWALCPYCETPVRHEAPARSAAKRRVKQSAPPPSERRRKGPSEAARRVSGQTSERSKAPSSRSASAERAPRPPKQRPASAKQRPPAKRTPTKGDGAPAPRAPAEGGEERSGSTTS